ncbi:uncharacterized protein LOC128375020 [Scomber japonicus]|uniref:uncharacterized protein LOC128375020 n=1 Tax=Scomber japonicus TaxID=13676 RepID=UPI0023056E24|nr:uncharacterized protein LOC128375020 [Scomber japonicus]
MACNDARSSVYSIGDFIRSFSDDYGGLCRRAGRRDKGCDTGVEARYCTDVASLVFSCETAGREPPFSPLQVRGCQGKPHAVTTTTEDLKSNIDHMQLVLLCREQDFKSFGQEIVFSPLIKDLKELEDSGIVLNNGKVIKGFVCAIAGDNLGSHCIGGFVENFSKSSHFLTLTAIEPPDLMFNPVTQDPSSSQSRSTSPSPLSYDSSGMTVNLSSWPEIFTFPWNRMPTGIRNAIAQETRPSAKDRREMVRVVVDDMRLSALNPSKSQCQTVARKIVREHPKSFADVMKDGTLIGSGFGSLATQLKTRVEHVNRGSILSRRRKSKNVSKSPADLARGPADQYGCVRWQPDCPVDETEESLKDKQREMKDLYSTEGPSGADRGHLTHLMKATYYLQRKTINASPPPSITELKNQWPYLFTPKELYSHFQLLTDIDILHKMEQAVEDKGKLILKFFEKKTAGPNADEKERILVKYSEDKCDPFPCVILLLMAHFKENPDELILQTDVLGTAADAERTLLLPDSPRLIVLGEVLTSKEWMLSIEGQVVVPPHPNFSAGLAALFSSYYSFNLVYQEQAACTLEFIQRCFVGINPSSGTKTAKLKNTINPHVSSLLRRLMDYEWLSA